MKLISEHHSYYVIKNSLIDILDSQKTLPDKVFKSKFQYFSFITFDEIFTDFFFEHLSNYISKINGGSFWLTTLEPEPILYFKKHFDFFGAMEFSITDTEQSFLSALHEHPRISPADAIVHSAKVLAIIPPSKTWTIYGDRDANIAICAFSKKEEMESFIMSYTSGVLNGIDSAADYAYGSSTNAEKLKQNYK